MRKYGYGVYIEWGCDKETGKPFHNCAIAPAKKLDLEFDGDNYICKCGSEGMKFFICKSIEDAIQKSNYNPTNIEFRYLNNEEIKAKNRFLADHIWSEEKGLISKEN